MHVFHTHQPALSNSLSTLPVAPSFTLCLSPYPPTYPPPRPWAALDDSDIELDDADAEVSSPQQQKGEELPAGDSYSEPRVDIDAAFRDGKGGDYHGSVNATEGGVVLEDVSSGLGKEFKGEAVMPPPRGQGVAGIGDERDDLVSSDAAVVGGDAREEEEQQQLIEQVNDVDVEGERGVIPVASVTSAAESLPSATAVDLIDVSSSPAAVARPNPTMAAIPALDEDGEELTRVVTCVENGRGDKKEEEEGEREDGYGEPQPPGHDELAASCGQNVGDGRETDDSGEDMSVFSSPPHETLISTAAAARAPPEEGEGVSQQVPLSTVEVIASDVSARGETDPEEHGAGDGQEWNEDVESIRDIADLAVVSTDDGTGLEMDNYALPANVVDDGETEQEAREEEAVVEVASTCSSVAEQDGYDGSTVTVVAAAVTADVDEVLQTKETAAFEAASTNVEQSDCSVASRRNSDSRQGPRPRPAALAAAAAAERRRLAETTAAAGGGVIGIDDRLGSHDGGDGYGGVYTDGGGDGGITEVAEQDEIVASTRVVAVGGVPSAVGADADDAIVLDSQRDESSSPVAVAVAAGTARAVAEDEMTKALAAAREREDALTARLLNAEELLAERERQLESTNLSMAEIMQNGARGGGVEGASDAAVAQERSRGEQALTGALAQHRREVSRLERMVEAERAKGKAASEAVKSWETRAEEWQEKDRMLQVFFVLFFLRSLCRRFKFRLTLWLCAPSVCMCVFYALDCIWLCLCLCLCVFCVCVCVFFVYVFALCLFYSGCAFLATVLVRSFVYLAQERLDYYLYLYT